MKLAKSFGTEAADDTGSDEENLRKDAAESRGDGNRNAFSVGEP